MRKKKHPLFNISTIYKANTITNTNTNNNYKIKEKQKIMFMTHI